MNPVTIHGGEPQSRSVRHLKVNVTDPCGDRKMTSAMLRRTYRSARTRHGLAVYQARCYALGFAAVCGYTVKPVKK